MTQPVIVDAQWTPNPNSYKFTVNREVGDVRGRTFSSAMEARESPLARSLFEIPGVRTLFFLKNFVTVGRAAGADWDTLVARVEEILRGYFESQPQPAP